MIGKKDEEFVLDEFREYLRNKGLKGKSVKGDISRLSMMKSRNIDYTRGEDCARELLYKRNI